MKKPLRRLPVLNGVLEPFERGDPVGPAAPDRIEENAVVALTTVSFCEPTGRPDE